MQVDFIILEMECATVRITGEVEDIHVLISKGRGYTCGIMSLSFINSEPIQHSSVSTAGGSGSMPSPAAPARSLSHKKKKKKKLNETLNTHIPPSMAMEIAHASMTMKGLPWKPHSHHVPSMAAPVAPERDFHGCHMAMDVAHSLHNLYVGEDPRKSPSMAM
jgi:hypothetical protein